ncbi:MAG: hypothetical protein ABF449_12350 [Ethanoligenens sp.]
MNVLNTHVDIANNHQDNSQGSVNYMYPHTLPPVGTPNSVGKQYDENGNLVCERFYGPDGKATKDRDYQHGGEHEFPHDHYWDSNGKRGGAESSTDETMQKAVGIGVVVLAGVGIVLIVADDITVIGIVDDVAEVTLSGSFLAGWTMIIG